MMKHVANLKACIFIYPYLTQPFTFPRFANSDRWFAIPSMLQTKYQVRILALFNRYIVIFTLFYYFSVKKSPSRHVSLRLESCISNR